MTAPALVALAHGSRDPRSAATVRALVDEVRAMRPDLRIEPAFLELSKPAFGTVVDKLVRAGYDEIVVVPLLLTEAYHAKVDVPARGRRGRPRGTRACRSARPHVLGLETVFLEVLDRRLREALRSPGARARRAGARRRRLLRPAGQPGRRPAGAAVGRQAPAARRWPPSPRPLPRRPVRRCGSSAPRAAATSRSGSLFLAPGILPDRAAELALEAGAVAVSAAARRRRRGGPHDPGPLRRGRRRARPRLTDSARARGR